MALSLRRKKKTKFQAAADGSMTLMDHLRELRSRLFKASLGVLLALIGGMFFAERVLNFLTEPYCEYKATLPGYDPAQACQFNTNSPVDVFMLNLRVALFIGLIVSAPIWLYQLWAFIAPGLHKHERRYTYYFAAVAGPLFIIGAVLAHFVISKSLEFFLGLSNTYEITVNLSDYFDFVTGVMLLFGAGFEFPLVIVLLNVIGIASAKRLLGWWRIAVFLVFLFCAIVTPTPDPFGMTALAVPMIALFFGAVGFAFLNDKRRAKKNSEWENLDPDEASVIEEPVEDIGEPEPIDEPDDIDPPTQPPNRRYDDDAT